jgi:hypothetical protein
MRLTVRCVHQRGGRGEQRAHRRYLQALSQLDADQSINYKKDTIVVADGDAFPLLTAPPDSHKPKTGEIVANISGNDSNAINARTTRRTGSRMGFTLPEALIAAVILSASVIGISGTLSASFSQTVGQGREFKALILCRELEEIAPSPSTRAGTTAGIPQRHQSRCATPSTATTATPTRLLR